MVQSLNPCFSGLNFQTEEGAIKSYTKAGIVLILVLVDLTFKPTNQGKVPETKPLRLNPCFSGLNFQTKRNNKFLIYGY